MKNSVMGKNKQFFRFTYNHCETKGDKKYLTKKQSCGAGALCGVHTTN